MSTNQNPTFAPPPSNGHDHQATEASKKPSGAKKLWDKTWDLTGKYIGEPSNKLIGKWGMESFWPSTFEKELDKAARILRVFTVDGGVQTDEHGHAFQNEHDPSAHKKHQKIIKKIPPKAIEQAKGIAIFTVFRTGLHWSAASGSGIVVKRLPDGSWSAPSGVLVHTIGVGLMVGLDIYDVVLVLNTDAAVEQFAHPRVKLGGDVSVAAGPVGEGRQLEVSRAASWSYSKSKGLYFGVQLDGTVVVERNDENARFYGRQLKAGQILAGEEPRPPQADGLYQVLAAAEGRQTTMDRVPKGMGPSEEYQTVTKEALEGNGQAQSQAELEVNHAFHEGQSLPSHPPGPPGPASGPPPPPSADYGSYEGHSLPGPPPGPPPGYYEGTRGGVDGGFSEDVKPPLPERHQ